ncbi:polysaccharide pyruvyl transferase family protein [Phyllobacterium zundukense]|jgi:colanic acid/amylovoran biosynthesis protein|uniref:Polysaccharide pyruvyl transferase family protein n=1 Tax=Phyllobacterium zundukense TaxID=1867719 RepID=A0ACD4D668_9HYPH|nr:polysaccharide pyruvyl transferase family protein [Phyllobacterium zundukense]UXN61361.1 polysaccharide pyruvyl transferase family protein [Phyllobacterium zundukense]
MKIIVENTVCLNTGDAAILLAIRHILRKVWGEDLRFQVFDSQPEVAARLYPSKEYPDLEFHKLLSESVFKYSYDQNVLKNAVKPLYNRIVLEALRRFGRGGSIDKMLFGESDRRSLEIYRDADLVITTGGTYLVENYNLERRLNQFRIDAIVGKDPVFFTQSLGPFNKDYNRQELKPVFDRSPLILLRDSRSRDHIVDLVDDPGKCHVVADAVFALADTDRIAGILAADQTPKTGRVAISVRHWNYVKGGGDGMRRYLDSIRNIVTKLVRDQGKEVTFLSTCQGVPEYAHDDSKAAKAIVAELDPEIASHVSVDASFHTPEQLMALVKGFDFVVATRMHMMIMSLCVGTPVLPIAYEFKTKEVAKRIGVSDVLLDIDTVTVEEAGEKLDTFIQNLEHYRKTSLKAVLDEHASAMSATGLLKPLLAAPSTNVAQNLGPDGRQSAA